MFAATETTLLVPGAIDPVPTGLNLFIPSPSDLLWSAVLLILIAVVFYKLIMPKLTAMLDERTRLIDGGIRQAEEVKAQADHALEQRQALLEEARAQAAQIRETAREEGATMVKDAKARATEEAQRTAAQANQQIIASQKAAEVALRQDVGDIAAQLASKIVREALVSPEAKSKAIDDFLDELDEQVPPHPDQLGDDGVDAPTPVDVADPAAGMDVAEPDEVVSRPWDPDSVDPFDTTEPSQAELATQTGAQD